MKRGKAQQMLVERATYMVNMVHWDPKYVWYVLYASSNTGAENWRKGGESGKEERRRGQRCLFLIKQVLQQEMSERSVLQDPLDQLKQIKN